MRDYSSERFIVKRGVLGVRLSHAQGYHKGEVGVDSCGCLHETKLSLKILHDTPAILGLPQFAQSSHYTIAQGVIVR